MPNDARASFSTSEIVRVLEIFGIGGLSSLSKLEAGSRRAPKLVAACASGNYLLKRRELQGAQIDVVRYTSRVHQYALRQGVPCARLMTTIEGEPLLIEGPFVYEVQEFVQGHRYTHRHDQAAAAGAALARFHTAMVGFEGARASAPPSYCRNPRVHLALQKLESSTADASRRALCSSLAARYERAATHAWPALACVTHSDYHPGNVLLDGARVVAIIDFDSARVAPVVSDLANAALQFGVPPIVGNDPSTWEPRFNEHCLRALVRGYRGERTAPKGTSDAIAPLMIQAAIQEVVNSVAKKGAFGSIDGWSMMAYVDRKTRWIEESSSAIATLCKP